MCGFVYDEHLAYKNTTVGCSSTAKHVALNHEKWVRLPPPQKLTMIGKAIGTGLAISTLGGVAIAVGIIFGALILGMSRAPWLST